MQRLVSLAVLVLAMAAALAPQHAMAAEDYRMKWEAKGGAGANTRFWRDPKDAKKWFSTDDNTNRVQVWTVTSCTAFRIELESRNAAGPIYGYLTDTEHGYRMKGTATTKIPGGFAPLPR
jgi:hypothetical protein